MLVSYNGSLCLPSKQNMRVRFSLPAPNNKEKTLGGYAFGVYEEPCPNCGGEVKYSYFAGDHYDTPTFDIYCDSDPKICGATFKKDMWEKFSKNKFKETARSGPKPRR